MANRCTSAARCAASAIVVMLCGQGVPTIRFCDTHANPLGVRIHSEVARHDKESTTMGADYHKPLDPPTVLPLPPIRSTRPNDMHSFRWGHLTAPGQPPRASICPLAHTNLAIMVLCCVVLSLKSVGWFFHICPCRCCTSTFGRLRMANMLQVPIPA
jgi:hypothetical protein